MDNIISFILAHPYLTISVITFLFFERAMYCGYVVDDDSMVQRLKAIKEKKKTTINHWLYFIRLSFYGAGFFRNAKQEHLFTIIIHWLNCMLIYKATGSLVAALLYCINPINNQTVLWLNGRRYAVTVLMVLLAWNFWPLAIPCLMFAAFIHASGYPAPLLWMWTPIWPVSFVVSGLMMVAGINKQREILLARKMEFKENNENQNLNPKKIILYVKSVGYHFFNCIFPIKPAMYHDFLFYFSATNQGTSDGYKINFDFFKGIAALSLIGYLIIVHQSFWAFWFILFISMWCNIYQVTMNASDRYCSLANVGVMALVAEWSMKLPSPYSWSVVSGLAVLYALKYFPLFRAYRGVELFHKYHLNLDPFLVNPRFFLSKIYIAKKDPFSAFAVIKDGLRYRPYDFKLLLSFIEVLFALGRRKDALNVMEFVEKNNCIQIGEEKDTADLFSGIRKEYKKEYELIHGKVNGKKYTHNNGQPMVRVNNDKDEKDNAKR